MTSPSNDKKHLFAFLFAHNKKSSICNSWALFQTISGWKEAKLFYQAGGFQSQLSFSDVSCPKNTFWKLLLTTEQHTWVENSC